MEKILLILSGKAIRQLNYLAKRRELSHETLLHEAIEQYLDQQTNEAISHAKGLWGKGVEDGLAYERKWREEW